MAVVNKSGNKVGFLLVSLLLAGSVIWMCYGGPGLPQ